MIGHSQTALTAAIADPLETKPEQNSKTPIIFRDRHSNDVSDDHKMSARAIFVCMANCPPFLNVFQNSKQKF